MGHDEEAIRQQAAKVADFSGIGFGTGPRNLERLEFWRSRFRAIKTPTPFLATRLSSGPGTQIGSYASQELSLSEEHCVRIRDRCDRTSITLEALVHGAWARLLGAYSDEQEVTFCTVVNRLQFGVAQNSLANNVTVGRLPITVKVARDIKISGWLKSIQSDLALYQQQLPTGLFISEDGGEYYRACSLATTILHCQASVNNFDQQRQSSSKAGDGIETSFPAHILAMKVVFEPRIRFVLSYREDRIEGGVAREMLEQFEWLIISLAEQHDLSLGEVPALPSNHYNKIVRQWNRTNCSYDVECTLHGLAEAQASVRPGHVAVVASDGQLTYAELDAEANRLAHLLVALNVQAGDLVGLCTDKSTATIVAMLAVMKVGAAYVPLDSGYPAARILYMVEDARLQIVLTWGRGTGIIRELGVGVVDLETLPHSSYSAEPLYRLVSPSALAYVIYTSGTSGQPKGVMLNHRGRINNVTDYCHMFEIGPGDKTLCVSSLSFDISVCDIFWTFYSGGTIVFPDAAKEKSPAHWLELMLRERITLWHSAPSLMDALLNEAQERDVTTSLLRLTVLDGDWIPLTLPDRVRSIFATTRVVSAGGVTELSVDSVTFPIGTIDASWRSIPYGRPMGNQTAYIVDNAMEPVPIGVPGELLLGGVGVGDGYLNRPDLTAERFITLPLCELPDERLYRTGDLARFWLDGTIELLGRIDHQVKIRGFRIELGEIEARLTEHGDVGEAVVVARADDAGDKRLVAYVVASGDAAGAAPAERAAALRAHLATHLPDYMVPAAYVMLEALPLTPNGKLDRQALPAPEGDAFTRQVYEAPQGPVEQALATVWSELLGIERISRHDNFFELGGHSLLAVRLLSRVQSGLAVTVPLATMFDRPSLASLAQAIDESSRVALPPIVAGSRDGLLPLSFAQQRLWFLGQLEGASATYNMPMALRLVGRLDGAAWKRSLDALFARHEALRTVFVARDGQPQAELLDARGGLPLAVHDLREAADPEGELARLGAEEAAAAFDLEKGPLIRGRLIRMDEEEHVLLLTMHHIVSDGWSMAILNRELNALYAAFAEGREDPLPPLAIQYPDYAAWQREWLSGERLEAQAQHWRRAMAGAPPLLELPTDRPRPAQQDFAGAFLPVELDAELTAGLKRLAQQHGATLFTTMLAAWSAVLSRLSGQDDLVIGTPSANRGRHEIEELIGFFVNTLALRIDLSGEPSISELLGRVRGVALAAQDNQDLPFEQVVEIVQPPRRLDHSPVFQVMFAWQNNDEQNIELPGLQVQPAAVAFDRVKFDLELSLGEQGDGIAGGLSYATALFDEATIARHRDYLLAVLRAMVADARQPVMRIDILPAGERRLLLEEWNRTEAAYPDQLCIHELFEEQAARDPEAVALVLGDQTLSYGELNARANRLAHHLIALGVGPDDRVAICAERSFEMVIGLIAILKAGGCYVPLDPAYPAERLAFMLADAAPRAILTHQAARVALDGACAGLDPAPAVLDLADTGAWAEQPDTSPDPASLGLTSRNLAYIIYTSGSTGTPKGVMVEHGNVSQYVFWSARTYALVPGSAAHVTTSLSFDATITSLIMPLMMGGTIYLSREGKDELVSLYRFSYTHVNAIAKITPSHIDLLFSLLEPEEPIKGRLTCIVGGEQLSSAHTSKWARIAPNSVLINEYGPTETTVGVTAYVSSLNDLHTSVPIGRPISNARIYLLDSHGEPVPLGATGELYIGGAGVARGYLNRPELTAERFVASPFVAGDRLYRTGDLGRYLSDGNIEFLGRNDHQVKIRGFRIELGEIEARLTEHGDVGEAVVVARADDAGDKRLVAYVVASGDAAGAAPAERAAALRAHLATHLPDYMVPAAYVMLEALPLTPNGKLDRQALPAPEGDAFTRQVYEAPQGPVEQALATVWSELLGIERISRHDNFFELGGHSLLAVRVVSRIRQTMRLELNISTFFSLPILSDIAKRIETTLWIDILSSLKNKKVRIWREGECIQIREPADTPYSS